MQRYSFQMSVGVKMDKPSKMENGHVEVNGKEPEKQEKQETVKEISEKIQEQLKNELQDDDDDDKRKALYTKEQEKKLLERYKHVPKPKLDRFVKFFKKADDENLGFVTVYQFAKAVRQAGFRGKDSEITDIFVDLDANQDFEMTLEEYLSAVTKKSAKLIDDTDLREAFRKMDLDKDGFISHSDIDELWKKMKFNKLDIDIDFLITRCDWDGDGKLSFEDFRRSYYKRDPESTKTS